MAARPRVVDAALAVVIFVLSVLAVPATPETVGVTPEPLTAVYERLLDEVGLDQAGQRLGIRVNVDRSPTRDELEDAVRREHLSGLRLRTGDAR